MINSTNRFLWIHPKTLLFALFGLLFLAKAHNLQANSLTIDSVFENRIVATFESYNACYWIGGAWSRVDWYVNGQLYDSDTRGGFNLSYRTINVQRTIWLKNQIPGATVEIKAQAYHHDYYTFGYFADMTGPITKTLKSYNPVSNVLATDSLYPNKVTVSWLLSECTFDSQTYNIYHNGNLIGNVPSGTKSFTHSNLAPGYTGTYTVRALINGSLLSAPQGNNGSTSDLRLNATTNLPNEIDLSWVSYSADYGADGYILDRINPINGTYKNLSSSSTKYPTSYIDNTTLIPGYLYKYRMYVTPFATTQVMDSTSGKSRPNGKISGTVHTPTTISNPNGVGVLGVKVVAKLVGAALPTDTTTTYTAVTGTDGTYTIPYIYYYDGATYTVTPILASRTFNPTKSSVTLNQSTNTATANFTDESSFLVSGTILQGACPMPNVQLWLDGDSTGVVTDANGKYNLTISNGGNYTIQPKLENHFFTPATQAVVVASNITGVNFTDTSHYKVDGYFTASCKTYIGHAKLRFYTPGTTACFSDTVTTDSNGYYSVKLPARKYYVDVINFTSNALSLDSITVKAYFSKKDSINLTYYDSSTFHHDTITKNFVYRQAPQLLMSGLNTLQTCSGETLPILQQHAAKVVKFDALESFNGSNCPAGDGYIVIKENITSDSVSVLTDTITYKQGDMLQYTLTVGTPNVISPYKKFIQAILYRDNQTDTVYSDVLVVGNKPRSQTFTTVSPEIPFQVLHNPPGDASYSYLEKSSSISNSLSINFQTESSVSGYIRAQLGTSLSTEIGFIAGVSIEATQQFDITASAGVGITTLTNDVTVLTTTATEKFQTGGSPHISGEGGDVFVGGALNMLYAVSDVLQYNFETCAIEKSKTLMMEPKGFATTFMYTENHITSVIIPELTTISDYYTNKGLTDSASYYQNQLNVWQQVIVQNKANIADATFIENKTFSGGVEYENSVQTTRSNTFSIDASCYVESSIATDIGASVGGMGLFGGVAISTKLELGGGYSNESDKTTTVGYVLSDDDAGDSYTVNILNDKVYGVPAFKLVAGRSSCPWEVGTLPREGVQLISNTYSKTVEESQPAVFTLQLANTSQSDETMTYDLVFDHTSNPDGAVITIGGSPVVGGIPYPYIIAAGKGTNATITVNKGPAASTYNGLKFTLKSSCDDQITSDVYLNASFYKEYDLTVAVSGSGTTNVAAGNHAYKEGETVVLYASPSQGYVFQKWVVGTEILTSQAIQVTIDSNKTATAYFVPTSLPQFSLQVSTVGNGSSIPPAGTLYFNKDSVVTLTASPDMYNAFVKWVINGVDVTNSETDVTITQNTTAVAYFVKTYTITVSVAEGEGTTTPETGINVCQDSTQVHFFASPSLGYVFEKWVINSVEYTTQSVDLTVASDVDAKAYFAVTTSPQYTVTISVNGEGGVTNPPAGKHYFTQGSTATITAYPNSGKVLNKWIVNSTEIADNPVNVTITGDVTIEASFVDDLASATETTKETNVISLYPNPSNGFINIKSDSKIERIVIVDITGKVVYDKSQINNSVQSMNLVDLNNGVYVIKVSTKTESSVFKIQMLKK